jgi:hypothetical protein
MEKGSQKTKNTDQEDAVKRDISSDSVYTTAPGETHVLTPTHNRVLKSKANSKSKSKVVPHLR